MGTKAKKITSKIILSDCLEAMKKMEPNSIDSLVTDPPAGISFMNKDWDKNRGGRECWVMWLQEIMEQCYRVLKPGAHGFVWAIPRTSHWTATALEDAGFEIRDIITHLFGSGFPKSLNISKSIDKAAGAEREKVGSYKATGTARRKGGIGAETNAALGGYDAVNSEIEITIPSTPEAKQWDGWGTALKPASEHWILIRKPISEKTVAKNVLKWGVGGISIDACRVEGKPRTTHSDGNYRTKDQEHIYNKGYGIMKLSEPQGRFPANLILDDVAGEMLDEQSGELQSGAFHQKGLSANTQQPGQWKTGNRNESKWEPSKGGASRFFYCAKPSKRERGEGNTHPTVKPIKLIRYLIRLITPPKGIVLDPFLGSGTTGCAAKLERFSFIGIDKTKEYIHIAKRRIRNA